MENIADLIREGVPPSEAFRRLFNENIIHNNHELIDYLDKEFEGIPAQLRIALINWNRGTNPEREGVGLSDERLNLVIATHMLELVSRGD